MAELRVVPLEKPLSDDPTASFTLPAKWYLVPEIYEREKEAIFYRNWIYVTHVSALAKAGDYATLAVADENVFVVRDHKGDLRAYYNVCRHRAHLLLEGHGNAKVITCPYHAWAYGLDGTLRNAPLSDDVPGFDKHQFCLQSVRLEELSGLVFVNLDPDARALAELAPDLADDLRDKLPQLPDLEVVDTQSFPQDQAIRANWKVVADNYLECYHCAKAHPAFADMICMDDYQMETFGIWSRQFGPNTRPRNSAYDFSPDAAMKTAGFWYIWPTTTINYVPGHPMVQVLNILPLDLETTVFSGDRLALGGDPDESRRRYLFEILGVEDLNLCESVQRGLKSRSYSQGRFVVDPALSGIAEHAVHHFHRLVKQALDG
jgi:carnitine monooxygenase subunit